MAYARLSGMHGVGAVAPPALLPATPPPAPAEPASTIPWKTIIALALVPVAFLITGDKE